MHLSCNFLRVGISLLESQSLSEQVYFLSLLRDIYKALITITKRVVSTEMWLEKSLGNCWGASHNVQSREHRLWKHEPIWPPEFSAVNSWARKHGARLCMPYWCYKTGSRLAVAWSISNSFTVPSVACSQMTFGWQKLGLQSWQSGMRPTVFWQTHNWPSDHQPTFCTQVTERTWAFYGSSVLVLLIFSTLSPDSNIEKT